MTRQVPGIKLPRMVRPVLRERRLSSGTPAPTSRLRRVFPSRRRSTVNNITDRAVVEGTITVSQDTDARTKLRVEGECVVKITGLGGKIESIIVENLMRSYRRLPDIVAEWMTVREAMLANPQPRAPPAVHAPTVHAGDDGDDESFSPTESHAGSSSSFLSRVGSGLRLGRVGQRREGRGCAAGDGRGDSSKGDSSRRGTLRRDHRAWTTRGRAAVSHRVDTPPLDKYLDRFRTAAGFESLSGGSGGGRAT